MKYFDELNLASNTQYFRQARAVSDSLSSQSSRLLGAVTLAKRPDELTVRLAGTDSLVIEAVQETDWNGRLIFPTGQLSVNNLRVFAAAVEEDQSSDNKTAYWFQNITTGKNSGWVNSRNYKFEGLTADSEYLFQVKARNGSGIETELGAIFKARTLKEQAPAIELVLTSALVSGNKLESVKKSLRPGDQVEYTIYYRNIGGQTAGEAFVLAKLDNFAGNFRWNNEAVTEAQDGDYGDYGKTKTGAIFIRLGDIPPGKGGKISYRYTVGQSILYPSIMAADAVLGYKGSPYLARAYNRDQIGDIVPVIAPESLAESSGVSREILFSLVNRAERRIGGGKSMLIPMDMGVSLEILENIAYAHLSGVSIFPLDKSIFVGSLAEPREAIKLDEEENSDIAKSAELENFFAQGGFQDKTRRFDISGELQEGAEELIIKGKAKEANIQIVVYVNDKKAGEAVTSAGGFWDFSAPYANLTDLRDVEAQFVVEGEPYPVGNPSQTSGKIRIGDIAVDLKGKIKGKTVPLDLKELTLDTSKIPELGEASLVEVLGDRVIKTAKDVYRGTKEFVEDTAEFVEKQEQPIQISLAIAAPSASLISPIIVSHVPFLPLYFFHLIGWVLGVFGMKRKVNPWGVVYDSVSKDPVALAIVRLFAITMEKGAPRARLIETQVTDRWGRYGFMPRMGSFYIEVVKPDYGYPSKIVGKGQTEDDAYTHLYHRQRMLIQDEDASVSFNIPIDPSSAAFSQKGKWSFSKMIYQIRTGLGHIVRPIIFGLTLLSGLILLLHPTLVNGLIFLAYFGLSVFQYRLAVAEVQPWGLVFDSSAEEPLAFAAISLVDAQYGRVMKSRLTDYQGRFSFLPPSGFYKILVKKEHYRFPSSKAVKGKYNYYGGKFFVDEGQKIVNMNIPLDSDS
ncbi:MAG: hypothetical protein HY602_01945 [Parcubacteria group bacterium]|nr:hypothetical protein [Parcubacteria group bacterium]